MSQVYDQSEQANLVEPGEIRNIQIPPHRRVALRNNWSQITDPIIRHLKLDLRYNTQSNTVDLRTNLSTTNPQALTKAVDFITAFINGFEINDALALVRLDDIFLEEFNVTDIKILHGDNLSRAVGRIAGKGGQIKYAIENATRTRISLTDTKVHLIGTQNNIKMAKRVICDLVMGSPANKIHAKLRGFQQWQKRQG